MLNLTAAKAYVALITSLVGSVATALVGIYGADSSAGRIITVVLAVVTALGTAAATYQTPNHVEGMPATNSHLKRG